MNDVCVIGLGYVGLPIAALWASSGLNVQGVDIDKAKLEGLRSGANIHEEPDVAELVRSTSGQGLLSFDARPKAADFLLLLFLPLYYLQNLQICLVFEAIESIGRG